MSFNFKFIIIIYLFSRSYKCDGLWFDPRLKSKYPRTRCSTLGCLRSSAILVCLHAWMLVKTHICFIEEMYVWVSESSMLKWFKLSTKVPFSRQLLTHPDYVESFFTLIFSLFHFSFKLGRFSSCQHLCSDCFNWKLKHNNAHQFMLVTRLAQQRDLMLALIRSNADPVQVHHSKAAVAVNNSGSCHAVKLGLKASASLFFIPIRC